MAGKQICIDPVCVLSWYKVADLTLLHSERPKLYTILAFLSAVELILG